MEVLSTILVPIVVALVSVALTAVITMKIKFSKSEKEAIEGLKKIGYWIFQFIWVPTIIFLLAREIMSDDPVTRRSVFAIALYVVSLVVTILTYILMGIMNIIGRMADAQTRHLSITERLVDASDETSNTPNHADAPDAKQSRG